MIDCASRGRLCNEIDEVCKKGARVEYSQSPWNGGESWWEVK